LETLNRSLQRGIDFQDEMRTSWRQIPNCWRMRITDSNGPRPADEIILLEKVNILAEHKRTEQKAFELNFLRPNQVKGLLNFDEILPQNFGVVFVSFHNEQTGLDTAYAVRLYDAITYMKSVSKLYVPLPAFTAGVVPAAEMPRLEPNVYDLKGVVEYFTNYSKPQHQNQGSKHPAPRCHYKGFDD
jgi:hypothetical protein